MTPSVWKRPKHAALYKIDIGFMKFYDSNKGLLCKWLQQ